METLTSIKWVAILFFVITLIGGGVYLKMHIDNLNQQIATLQAQNNTLALANKQDAANIQDANTAINNLKEQNAANSAAAGVALAQAQKLAASRQTEIATLQAQKATGNTTEDCDTLNQNLNNFISSFGSQEQQ
jgi:predicted negative regulator of RcsB-dependent stress response